MAILRRLCPILFLLLWGGGQLLSAATREDRAYTTAVTYFGESNWDRAQMLFAQFADKYASSTNVPEAVLLQSQALFRLGRYDATVSLLNNVTNLTRARTANLADQYVYWIGEAHYAAGQFQQSADTFVGLTTNFPNSYLRLRSLIEAAAAYGQLNNWGQVVSLLETPGGVFAAARKENPADELVVRGELFLAQARYMQKDLGGAMAILNGRDPRTINLPALGWGWAYLRFTLNLGSTNRPAALVDTTNLLAVAHLENDATNLAEATALQAGLLERSGRPEDALAVYQQNLGATVPEDRQRQAVLKVAELAVDLKQIANAEQALEGFLIQYTNPPAMDLVLLTLGELHLLNDTLPSANTNDLALAQERFEQLTAGFGGSPLVGKAYLDLGWCNWLSRQIPERSNDPKIAASLADFTQANNKLTSQVDLAVARFKMGDALLILTNFTEAVANYQSVLNIAESEPILEQGLAERALYQMLRAELAIPNLAGANEALTQLQEKFPLGNAAQSSLLLYGESLPRPAAARELFESYQSRFTNSALLPRIQLAIARTYELDHQWYMAMTNYYSWLAAYPTNASLRPGVEYSLANASYQLGDEPTAMLLFTNFVANYPTNDLAPLAQWWVADAYFRQGNWRLAELSYQIIQNLARPNSPLFYEAELMAGRAAMGRAGYSDARTYFVNLLTDITNCPPDLAVQARFAYGNALMLIDSTDTNNPNANFQLATNIFAQIPPTNEVGFMALGLIAECDYTMGDYLSATNNYSRVANAEDVSVSVRSQARIGLGLTLEKLAQFDSGAGSLNLLKNALNQYLDVFDTQFGENDPFWVKKAGLQALPLMQTLGAGDSNKFIDRMEQLFPQSRDFLEKKRLAASPPPPPVAGN